MGRLDDITLEELQDLKEEIDEGKPRERVLAAIGRKQGDYLYTLADRHGVVEKTIRNWLDQFEEQPLEQAPFDAPRPGGPAKIEAEERERLFEELQQPPTEFGYEQQAWFPKLLLHHVKEEYGVEYSKAYAYELLEKAGLSLRTARPRHHEADPEEKAEFEGTVEKNGLS
jgi:Transposase and inactivated derivatives